MKRRVCRFCGEEYTDEDLQELHDMNEHYYLGREYFLCPDCWDDFRRLTLEQQAEILLRDNP